MKKSLLALAAAPVLVLSSGAFAAEVLSADEMDSVTAGRDRAYVFQFNASPVTLVQANVLTLGGGNFALVGSGNFSYIRQ
ncbi:hypothetical protein E4K72_18935 [Oxalobacteraceae bacterium OM1]|nr:hypothetical protein E4K72_18935 [Oxalobacteraceae bacterium OM1]